MRIFGYLVPFRFMPGSWGLKGETFDRAEAEYSLEGEALYRRKAEINFKDDPAGLAAENIRIDCLFGKLTDYERDEKIARLKFPEGSKELERELLVIAYRAAKIDKIEFDRKTIALDYVEGTPDMERAMLDVDFQHGVIGEKAYEKAIATLDGEPWVGVLNSEFTSTGEFSLELDWNDQFIVYLRENGYTGPHDADIVDRWLADINAASAPDEEVMSLPLAGRRPYPIR